MLRVPPQPSQWPALNGAKPLRIIGQIKSGIGRAKTSGTCGQYTLTRPDRSSPAAVAPSANP